MIRTLVNTIITLFVLAFFFPNIQFSDWTTLIIAGGILTVINKVIKPVLKILTLPINIVTLGFFSIALNIGLLWLAIYLVPGFEIQPMILAGIHLGYISTLIVVSALISFIQNIINLFIGGEK